MIDWSYEDRLIARVDIRKLARDRLTPRERRIMCCYYRYGETLREVGQREGVTGHRINQILAKAERRLYWAAHRQPIEKPPSPDVRRTLRQPPPPSFDRAAFIRHMQELIRLRERDRQRTFEYEYAKLEDMLMAEAMEQQSLGKAKAALQTFAKGKAELEKQPPKPAQQSKVTLQKQLWEPGYAISWPAPPPKQTPVEAWFDPARLPTVGDMAEIARYALGYFAAIRDQSNDGLRRVGTYTAHIVCRRDADTIAEAMQRVKNDIPASARISAVPITDVPLETLSATIAGSRIAMLVASVHEGKQVAIYLTYDLA